MNGSKPRLRQFDSIPVKGFNFNIKVWEVKKENEPVFYIARGEIHPKGVFKIPFCEYTWKSDFEEIMNNIGNFIQYVNKIKRNVKKWTHVNS